MTPATPIGIDIMRSTRCEHDYACLTDDSVCQTETFLDRDVPLTKCLSERDCHYKTLYHKMTICGCPVQRARLS